MSLQKILSDIDKLSISERIELKRILDGKLSSNTIGAIDVFNSVDDKFSGGSVMIPDCKFTLDDISDIKLRDLISAIIKNPDDNVLKSSIHDYLLCNSNVTDVKRMCKILLDSGVVFNYGTYRGVYYTLVRSGLVSYDYYVENLLERRSDKLFTVAETINRMYKGLLEGKFLNYFAASSKSAESNSILNNSIYEHFSSESVDEFIVTLIKYKNIYKSSMKGAVETIDVSFRCKSNFRLSVDDKALELSVPDEFFSYDFLYTSLILSLEVSDNFVEKISSMDIMKKSRGGLVKLHYPLSCIDLKMIKEEYPRCYKFLGSRLKNKKPNQPVISLFPENLNYFNRMTSEFAVFVLLGSERKVAKLSSDYIRYITKLLKLVPLFSDNVNTEVLSKLEKLI